MLVSIVIFGHASDIDRNKIYRFFGNTHREQCHILLPGMSRTSLRISLCIYTYLAKIIVLLSTQRLISAKMRFVMYIANHIIPKRCWNNWSPRFRKFHCTLLLLDKHPIALLRMGSIVCSFRNSSIKFEL